MRNLVVVLGDQLNSDSVAFKNWDPQKDALFMAEVKEESQHVWSHKARIAMFLSAMRAFRDSQKAQGHQVYYTELDDPENRQSLGAELQRAIDRDPPQKVVMVEAGDFRVQQQLQQATQAKRIPLEVLPDAHFHCSRQEFEEHAQSRKQLRLEFFYREMRQKTGYLMNSLGKPIGDAWNFDTSNRKTFGKKGPTYLPPPIRFVPNETTQTVLKLVEKEFPNHPGKLTHFDWPVTPQQAQKALDDFITYRLPLFGDYQDAMWTNQPWLYHSRLSAAMNLKILDPRQVIQAAEQAYKLGHAPLEATEGFIRQILGWREYVRGIYWKYMPDYLGWNALNATLPLPKFYWTAETEMNCLRQAIGQTLEYGYAHHIQRLMVTGLFSLLFGVHPVAIHEWYLAVYVDAIEWVELPNTLGMSQYADGGIMASKPYVATGKYIQRMSNYCTGCRYNPVESTGEKACPFTTLYWDFLARHQVRVKKNPRMTMQMKNLARLGTTQLKEIQKKANQLRETLAST
ncbi:MAG: cryptochrome/photolyase family protein [Gemmataceae bacterium]|jgi:deoxyribodipyrimidine photolyase-related protein|nr:cryptochrome/photolyase family protein [Gemmataceae bacterium]